MGRVKLPPLLLPLALLLPLLVVQTLGAPKKPLPLDCEDLYNYYNANHSGVYTIYPTGNSKSPLQVYCDMGCNEEGSHNKGQWTVIQRRVDGTVSFYRAWKQYKSGFGTLDGEHWLGLENIYQLTRKKNYQLKVDLEDFDDATAFARYTSFYIDAESNKYQLHVTGFIEGGAGDSLSIHNGLNFVTFDGDQSSYYYCIDTWAGGFWYSCSYSNSYCNPNGIYKWGNAPSNTGVIWASWKGSNYSLKRVVMKIRRRSLADLKES